jgi:hypothetical protein
MDFQFAVDNVADLRVRGDVCGTAPPSVLPDISPSWGEIGSFGLALPKITLQRPHFQTPRLQRRDGLRRRRGSRQRRVIRHLVHQRGAAQRF